MFTKASRKEYAIILTMTFGSILEWYEIFIYVYWAPVISKLFFGQALASVNLLNSLLIFMIGFWARPIGGFFFGRIGDLVGRKYALILSIVILIFPTLFMGLLPTYDQIGIFSPICLILLRFLQAIPSGGELPGSFCYLYEYAPLKRRRYITSWGAIGSQIGIAISMIESKYIESILPHEALVNWGWRISFIFGSFIALLGLLLRSKLHETPVYQQITKRHEKLKISFLEIIKQYRRPIVKIMVLGLLNSAGFYILCAVFPIYIGQNGVLSGLSVLILGSIFIPFIGYLGDRFNNKKMLIASVIGIILILYPMYFFGQHSHNVFLAIFFIAFILFLSVSAALLPYRFAALFPANIRFTGVGIGFNLGDGVLGSLSTVLAFILMSKLNSLLPCYLIIFICAILSLLAMFTIKEEDAKHH